jgi:hypothetical protein
MFFNTTLPAIAGWITYCVQIGLAYLVAWGVCSLVRDPRFRLRIWGAFVFLAAFTWFVICIPGAPANSLPLSKHAIHLPGDVALHGIWTIQGSWAPQVSWLANWAWRIYLLVLTLSVPHLGWKALRLWLFLRNAGEPSTELSALFQRLCRQMKVPRCKLLLHADLRSPATAGWLRPQILLPTELVPLLEGNQLTDVLRHELTHVSRRDYFWDRLAALACRLVFFHPAIWLAYRCVREERELVCDLAVVKNRPELRLRYAECLAKLARWCFLGKGNSSHTIAFASSASLLSTRVRALLREPSPQSRLYQITRGALIPMLMGLAVYLLPTVGLSFRWSDSGASARQPAVASGPSRERAFGKLRFKAPIRKTVITAAFSQTETFSTLPERANAPPGLFSGLNSVALPVLVAPSSSPGVTQASSGSRFGGNGETAPHPVWDEAGSPRSSLTRPDWGGLASGAVAVGVALATREQNEEGERRDH